MFPTFLIFFREILEIALVLTIILAATRGVKGRGRAIWLGLAGGLAGSFVVAGFADIISNLMQGLGQEWFNGLILMLAVMMIGWTVVWMKRHGKHMATHIRTLSEEVKRGKLPLFSVSIIVALCMWREGSEIVLFMYGLLATSEEPLLALIAGGIGGTLVAGGIGLALYLGLLRLSTRWLFTVSGWLLILVAAGMAAAAAGYFTAAGVLPELVSTVWDSSTIISESSVPGKILHAMIGYTERPSGMQLIWYLGTIAAISFCLYLTGDREKNASERRASLLTASFSGITALGVALWAVNAHAGM